MVAIVAHATGHVTNKPTHQASVRVVLISCPDGTLVLLILCMHGIHVVFLKHVHGASQLETV